MPSYFPVRIFVSASYFRATLTVEQGNRVNTGFLVVVAGSLVVELVSVDVAIKVGSAIILQKIFDEKI